MKYQTLYAGKIKTPSSAEAAIERLIKSLLTNTSEGVIPLENGDLLVPSAYSPVLLFHKNTPYDFELKGYEGKVKIDNSKLAKHYADRLFRLIDTATNSAVANLNLPSMQELRKCRSGSTFSFGECLPQVSAKALLDVMIILGFAYNNRDYRAGSVQIAQSIDAVFVWNENGWALVAPIARKC